ncbi:MAG: methyltransferase domain-containing protein [bacterium]|nr:methyltransferase domain-containing protein [bacterium]
MPKNRPNTFFHSAEWYDLSINWAARLAREIPLLGEVFGPPGDLGLLDAGCGTGRQTAELARRGYAMTGLDPDDAMLTIAREHARSIGADVKCVAGTFDDIPQSAPGPFDGIFCLGNALATCTDAASASRAVARFAQAIRPGGRLFVQILNFPPMRAESPCVRGPRVVVHDGVEYVSARLFHFVEDGVDIANVTLYKQDTWRHEAGGGRLYPITPDELRAWCADAGLRVDQTFGAYDQTPFDPQASVDLILTATRE